MKRIFYFLVLLPFSWGCGQDCREGELVEKVNVDLEMERLDLHVSQLQNRAEVAQFLRDHPLFAKRFLRVDEYPHDSIVVNDLYQLVQDAKIDSLNKAVDKEFGKMRGISADLKNLFRHILYYYPQYHVPEINTMVTGFGSDFYSDDSLIVIGLEYYLDRKSKYQPTFPQYMLTRYQPEYIVPAVATAVSGKFNVSDPTDQTLMADMVYYGKSLYFMRKVMPCLADTLLFGYSAEEIKRSDKSEKVVWAYFLDRNLLFERSPMASTKYTGERPYIGEIGPDVPGRIGRWLGYKIVKGYMERQPNLTLQDLMAEKDAQKIFQKSKYKPS